MNNLKEKKEYMTPKMKVVKLKESKPLLCSSDCNDGYVDYEDGNAE